MGAQQRRLEAGLPNIQSQPQQIPIDISNATQLSCKCGCKFFQPAVALYAVSAILSPTGQELLAQQPVIVCLSCGEQFTGEKKIVEC